ncbi:hypothetical protein OG905_13345 [Streptomyces sp. NBC_00322]|uniref:hypothetical protein n=1 Tax=Streptomyces sp. NBC_00322 TaxID=2975712 RepID=UPI002E289249|nr:hypothetical protein [Streptomyces sp. NBC_00322]
MDRSTEFTFGIAWIMSFFHQDWTLDASTEAEAVADQFVEELEPDAVLLVRRDARLLLDGLPSDWITVLWEGCAEGGEYFFRRGRVTDGAEWMRQVIGVCDAWLSRRPDTTTLLGADRYEGRELADEVLSAVEEFRGVLDREVADALAECVRHTPDLAFRLLLRALPMKSASLSPESLYLSEEQYARLAALGKAFHYGEYVVSDIKYLVDTIS